MNMSTHADRARFQSGADRYVAYLETPEGRLRSDLAFANLLEFLPAGNKDSLRALDLGCGTGATAVRLAELGIHVTLLDSSHEMLEIAERAAREAGVSERIVLTHRDVAQLASFFGPESFDVILCNNLLEFVEDPGVVLRDAACLMRDSRAILSVLVRNQAGEVLKAAIEAGNLAVAENSLIAEWGQESLYGGRVRLFTSDSLQRMLKAARLGISAERGVRVVADYLPSRISRSAEYERIFDLERKLGRRREFAGIARYIQCVAHRPGPMIEDGA